MEWNHKKAIFAMVGVLLILEIISRIIYIFAIEGLAWLSHFTSMLIFLGCAVAAFIYYRRTQIREFMLISIAYGIYFFLGPVLILGGDSPPWYFIFLRNMIFFTFLTLWAIFIYFFSRGIHRKIHLVIGSLLLITVIINFFVLFITHGELSFFILVVNAFAMYISISWLIVLLNIKLMYKSKRVNQARILWIIAAFGGFLSSAPIFITNVYWNVAVYSVGITVWEFVNFLIFVLFPEGLILTKAQSLAAIRSYDKIIGKKRPCEVFCSDSLNNYFKDIPEDLIEEIGDPKLKEVWDLLNTVDIKAT